MEINKNHMIVLCVVISISLLLSIASLVISLNEGFANIKFPEAGDAQKTGWYRTLNRQCEPGLHKCYIKNNSGSYHYYCSDKDDCYLKDENVKGTKIQEPMAWQVRYA
jgi:hypothetical protein